MWPPGAPGALCVNYTNANLNTTEVYCIIPPGFLPSTNGVTLSAFHSGDILPLAMLLLPMASLALFFVRQVNVNKTAEVGTTANFPDPKGMSPEPKVADPVPEDTGPVETRSAFVETMASPVEPTVFEVPPERLPVAEVPKGEFFGAQEQANIVNHLNELLQHEADILPAPLNPWSDEVLDKIGEGQLLSRALAKIDPDVLDLRALNKAAPGEVLSPLAMLQNNTLLVNAAASIGKAVPHIHETQLLYAPDNKQVALNQTWNIVQHGLLSKINVMTHPELKALLENGEKPSQVPVEALLARYLNKQVENYLEQHPQDRRQLPSDLKIDEKLEGDLTVPIAMALHQLAHVPIDSQPVEGGVGTPTSITGANASHLPFSNGAGPSGAYTPQGVPFGPSSGSPSSGSNLLINPLHGGINLAPTSTFTPQTASSNPGGPTDANSKMVSNSPLGLSGKPDLAELSAPIGAGGAADPTNAAGSNMIHSSPLAVSSQPYTAGASAPQATCGWAGPSQPANCSMISNDLLTTSGQPGSSGAFAPEDIGGATIGSNPTNGHGIARITLAHGGIIPASTSPFLAQPTGGTGETGSDGTAAGNNPLMMLKGMGPGGAFNPDGTAVGSPGSSSAHSNITSNNPLVFNNGAGPGGASVTLDGAGIGLSSASASSNLNNINPLMFNTGLAPEGSAYSADGSNYGLGGAPTGNKSLTLDPMGHGGILPTATTPFVPQPVDDEAGNAQAHGIMASNSMLPVNSSARSCASSAPDGACGVGLGAIASGNSMASNNPLLFNNGAAPGHAANANAAGGDGSSTIAFHQQALINDPMGQTNLSNLPTVPVVPQPLDGAESAKFDSKASGLGMPLNQAVLPTLPLLSKEAGEGLPKSFWTSTPEERARQVLSHAHNAAGQRIFSIVPTDLTEPRQRMQQAFIASVVDAFPGGAPDDNADAVEIPLEGTEDAAEERVFRHWAASLGLKLNMKDLYHDSTSGVVLLKVMEKLKPGCVDWSKVEGTPKNNYVKIANCNYAVQVARTLGCKLVGIAGSDIAAGSPKLTLAIWWQLMRMDFMNFIADLDMDQAHVLAWANAQVAASGCDIQLTRFGDPEIKSGVFLLRLMAAVAPEALDQANIKPGFTPHDQQLNAKLAISTSHKMGARVFCGWHDIIEARPKLMLSMMAAVMAVAFKNKTTTKSDVLKQVAKSKAQLEAAKASERFSRRSSSVASILSAASGIGSPRSKSITRSNNPNKFLDVMRKDIKCELEEESTIRSGPLKPPPPPVPPPPTTPRQRIVDFFSSIANMLPLPGRSKASAFQEPSHTGFKLRLGANEPVQQRVSFRATDGDVDKPIHSPTLHVRNLGFDPSSLPKAPPVAKPPGIPPASTPRGGAPFKPSPRLEIESPRTPGSPTRHTPVSPREATIERAHALRI